MRAGQAKHRLTFQQATETQNEGGEPVPAWSRFKVLYCAIVPLSGRELEVARQTYGEVSHRLETKYTPGIVSKMRAIRGPITSDGEPDTDARLFEIEGAINVGERNREMDIFCREHV